MIVDSIGNHILKVERYLKNNHSTKEMDNESEILSLKADIKMIENRYNALIDVLSKEGVIVISDIEEKLSSLIEKKEEKKDG